MKDTSKILLGLGALVIVSTLIAENDKVGKIEDFINPPRGRIDRYWRGKLNMKNLVGRKFEMSNDYLSPEKISTKYNLFGIEFGNWMNQEDRASNLVALAVSLHDITKVFNIPAYKVGNKILSVAIGARGASRAAAHYEREQRTNTKVYYPVINLTKTNGPGSLVHEFGHYLDNTVGKKLKNNDFGSGSGTRKKVNENLLAKRNIESEYEKLFLALYFDDNGNETKYYHDQMERSDYFQSRVEVFARTIEAYTYIRLKELKLENKYLVTSIRKDWPPLALVQKGRKPLEKILRYAFS